MIPRNDYGSIEVSSLIFSRTSPHPTAASTLTECRYKELQSKLKAGEFVTAEEARQWLEEKHGVIRPYATVWPWLKKAGGVLLVPRPSHSKKDPAAAH